MTLKKLEKAGLVADRAAILDLISQSDAVGDYLGRVQFMRKLDEIDSALRDLESISSTRAAVALYFGGPKIVGSQGIDAEFAGDVLGDFQDLVSKAFARKELGSLGSRGPVPVRSSTNLMVTSVARGSFGFVLEEVGSQGEAFDTELVQVVDDVTNLIADVVSSEEEEFMQAISSLDDRSLTSTRRFFATLSKASATMRIVERDRELLLDRSAVELGRERTEQTQVEESEGERFQGVLLGLLPQHRRFEFKLLGSEETISGRVDADISQTVGDQLLIGGFNPVGKAWNAEFNVRTVVRPGRTPRRFYTLLQLHEEIQHR